MMIDMYLSLEIRMSTTNESEGRKKKINATKPNEPLLFAEQYDLIRLLTIRKFC